MLNKLSINYKWNKLINFTKKSDSTNIMKIMYSEHFQIKLNNLLIFYLLHLYYFLLFYYLQELVLSYLLVFVYYYLLIKLLKHLKLNKLMMMIDYWCSGLFLVSFIFVINFYHGFFLLYLFIILLEWLLCCTFFYLNLMDMKNYIIMLYIPFLTIILIKYKKLYNLLKQLQQDY